MDGLGQMIDDDAGSEAIFKEDDDEYGERYQQLSSTIIAIFFIISEFSKLMKGSFEKYARQVGLIKRR